MYVLVFFWWRAVSMLVMYSIDDIYSKSCCLLIGPVSWTAVRIMSLLMPRHIYLYELTEDGKMNLKMPVCQL